MLTLLVLLLLGGVVAAVVLSAGVEVHCSFEPKTTADGSVCKPFNGDCIRLSRSAMEARLGIRVAADARLEASGSKPAFKSYEAWAVACVPDVTALLRDAERPGFVESPVSDFPGRHDWSGKGPVSREVRLTAPVEAARWLDVGGGCDGGTWVYLRCLFDK